MGIGKRKGKGKGKGIGSINDPILNSIELTGVVGDRLQSTDYQNLRSGTKVDMGPSGVNAGRESVIVTR